MTPDQATAVRNRGVSITIPLPSSIAAKAGAVRTRRPQLVLLEAFSAMVSSPLLEFVSQTKALAAKRESDSASSSGSP